jgi:hypothetical protein
VNTNISWNNTPNTGNAHNLIAYLNYRDKFGAIQRLASAQRNVTVKHIGAITSMGFGGGTSPTNPANNTNVVVPCGGQSFPISCATPVTDPASSIVYTWSLPSNWSGSSSTNSITVTPTAGSGGTIAVSARRTDGTTIQTYSVSVTRPVVTAPTIATIDGSLLSKAICAGSSKTFTGSASNVGSRLWTTSGGLSLFGPSSAPNVIIGGSSKGVLTLTVDNACQSPKSKSVDIFIGAPTIQTATVNGGSLSTPNYISNPCLLNIGTGESGVTYNWVVTNGTGSIYYNGNNQVSAYAYPFVRIDATIGNLCGTSTPTAFYLYNVGGGFYKMASPNPATNTVSADVILMGALKSMTLVSDTRASVVRTFSPTGVINTDTQRASNTVSFDVSRLARGRYYLNFTFEGDKKFTNKLF